MPWKTDVHFTDVEGSFGDYMLDADLVYEDWAGREWTTPKGFVGDLSSIPWFIRWLIPKTILGKTPWLHDYLYRASVPGATRDVADWMFYTGAVDEGMATWKAKTLWRGLRIGGWAAWQKRKH